MSEQPPKLNACEYIPQALKEGLIDLFERNIVRVMTDKSLSADIRTGVETFFNERNATSRSNIGAVPRLFANTLTRCSIHNVPGFDDLINLGVDQLTAEIEKMVKDPKNDVIPNASEA